MGLTVAVAISKMSGDGLKIVMGGSNVSVRPSCSPFTASKRFVLKLGVGYSYLVCVRNGGPGGPEDEDAYGILRRAVGYGRAGNSYRGCENSDGGLHSSSTPRLPLWS